MYQTGGTIKEALEAISANNYVLPAIQREFVWKPPQICKLFDSLMQGYPFGTFLFWEVKPENAEQYKFYQFMRNYHERDNAHCTPLNDMGGQSLTAILDGQQRLTALNIGLRGTMALKLRNSWWTNSNAFPQKALYLNLLSAGSEPDENGIRYGFEFLTEERASAPKDDECWYPVSQVMTLTGGPAMVRWLNKHLSQEQVDLAYPVLDQLYRVVHDKNLIAYYEEKSQDLEKVLNIFIRTNSGGTILSYSDLLLSIAVAQWSEYDARDEIHSLVDEINAIGQGFSFSKDLVLKAGLMLSDIGNVGFKVENFNKENMGILEQKWKKVKTALLLSVELISSFGFSGQTLRADSALLPIAYYIYTSEPGDGFISKSKYKEDREQIRDWLTRSLLKASGIWGSGLDTLLTAIRDVIKANKSGAFPYDDISEVMARRGKSLKFVEEEIEELSEMSYGDKRIFSLLALVFPFVNTGYNFHIDHVFPKGEFSKTKLVKSGVSLERVEEYKQNCNRLANLQLLLGAVNNEKRTQLPAKWLKVAFPDKKARKKYKSDHALGKIPKMIAEFDVFYETRKTILENRIRELLG